MDKDVNHLIGEIAGAEVLLMTGRAFGVRIVATSDFIQAVRDSDHPEKEAVLANLHLEDAKQTAIEEASANRAAVKEFFTGPGAMKRVAYFIAMSMKSGLLLLVPAVALYCLFVAVGLFGIGGDSWIVQLHALLTSMTPADVLNAAHGMRNEIVRQALLLAVPLGVLWELSRLLPRRMARVAYSSAEIRAMGKRSQSLS